MDFIMEDLDSTSNDVYDDDWMMEEPEMEDEENNEDDHMDESDDDMFSGTNEETLDNHYTEGSVLTADTIHNDDASEDVAIGTTHSTKEITHRTSQGWENVNAVAARL